MCRRRSCAMPSRMFLIQRLTLWICKIPELAQINLEPGVRSALGQLHRVPSYVSAAVLKVWLNASPSKRRFGNPNTKCAYACGAHYDQIRHYIQCHRFRETATKCLHMQCTMNPLWCLGIDTNTTVSLRAFSYLYAHHILHGHILHQGPVPNTLEFLREQLVHVQGESLAIYHAFRDVTPIPAPIAKRVPHWQISNASAPDFASSTESCGE